MTTAQQRTIAAIATPPGKGGVSIIRVSGPKCQFLCQTILGKKLTPRQAYYLPFLDQQQTAIDQGLAIYFAAPNSFTGEDVLEFQGHGGPIIMDLLLQRIVECGIELAKPGEFSEKAFLNDKLDLAQAEAIADLIESGSRQAAKSALRSLSGDFSKEVHQLVDMLVYLRTYVEAAIDFPDEEIDFLQDQKVIDKIQQIRDFQTKLIHKAQQGNLLREGMTVVIAGKPNAGKSSLLNALVEKESAIVTHVEGTTRDILTEQINIDGLPLHIVDTAGLRKTDDLVEKIGIGRAINEIEKADRLLLVVDASQGDKVDLQKEIHQFFPKQTRLPPISLIKNKIDLINKRPTISQEDIATIFLSASNGDGVKLLKDHLKQVVGYNATESGVFMARRRHLTALDKAQQHIEQGFEQLIHFSAGELLAEELKLAQLQLNEITGEFTSDDLLGNIFSSFCIGK